MLHFFKVNDPYRLFFLLILMLLIRLPFYWSGVGMLLPDLNYMLIGERLASGSVLYKDLWVNIGPLSAIFFTMMHWLFSKSIVAYHVVGFMIMFIQTILFNRLALGNKIYTENNYVPGLIYAILMSISIDMFTVSPIMLSVTFILLAMNNIFGQVEFRAKRDEKILNIGIYLGVAALFYFPAILFGLIAILGLALFSATIFRRYILILYGLALPFLLIGAYYFFVGNTAISLNIFFSSWFGGASYRLDRISIIVLCAIPLFYLMRSIIRIIRGTRFSNYQARIAQMMLFWLVLSLFLLFGPTAGLSDLIVFVPPMAYFITHLFVLSKKKVMSEVNFLIFLSTIIGLSYAAFFNHTMVSKYVSYEPLAIINSRYDNLLNGQKVWVIGDDLQLYKNSTVASKFYSWETYSKLLLGDENNDYKTALVYDDLTKNAPSIIIDKHGVMTSLLMKMPSINSQYERLEKGVYIRKGFKLEPL